MVDLKKTGLFISSLRKRRNMTQNELAQKIGVTDKAVSRWETGKGFPDVSLLPPLAEALGVSISEIVMGESIEIEEKKTLDIMDRAVISTLDFSGQKEEKTALFKKYIIPVAVLVIAVVIIFAFFYIRDWGRQDFIYNGDVFQPAKVSSKKITLRDPEGEMLVFTKSDMITTTVVYKDNYIRYGGGFGGLIGVGYNFSDGTNVTAFPLPDLTELQRQEIRLIDSLTDYFNGISLKYRYPVYYVLILIMVIAIIANAMYMVVYTEDCLEKHYLLRLFVRGEPTEFTLLAAKFIGIIAIAISIIVFLSVIAR